MNQEATYEFFLQILGFETGLPLPAQVAVTWTIEDVDHHSSKHLDLYQKKGQLMWSFRVIASIYEADLHLRGNLPVPSLPDHRLLHQSQDWREARGESVAFGAG
jgi:hypothetical protein